MLRKFELPSSPSYFEPSDITVRIYRSGLQTFDHNAEHGVVIFRAPNVLPNILDGEREGGINKNESCLVL